MFEIRTEYRNQGKDVVGARFADIREAEEHLAMHGWSVDEHNRGPRGERVWEKGGATRMVGLIGICMTEYVYVAET